MTASKSVILSGGSIRLGIAYQVPASCCEHVSSSGSGRQIRPDDLLDSLSDPTSEGKSHEWPGGHLEAVLQL